MTALVLAVALTLGVSAFCSLLEAFILSITVAEIEDFKARHPRMGALLEHFKQGIDLTSSAILTLNTVANTLGATVVGAIAKQYFPTWVSFIAGTMVFGILFFSEIIPKNLGVAYRRSLRFYLVYPLWFVRTTMWPLATLARYSIRVMLPKDAPSEEEQEQEILLLAEKSASQGGLSVNERDLITNALKLDDIKVADIMTPRTVVTFLEDCQTVGEICEGMKIIPFARMPVYNDNIDNVVGLARRRDILQAYGDDNDAWAVSKLMHPIIIVPDSASAGNVLQQLVAKHQQLALVVDEYGSTAGVITLEDIFEHLLGREIYEDSDVAVDMRELARSQAENGNGSSFSIGPTAHARYAGA